MSRQFEVRWEGELAGPPETVWAALTEHTGGWLWPIEYEPRAGGAERGLTAKGGTVTVGDPPARFGLRNAPDDELNDLEYRLEPAGAGTVLRYTHRVGIPGDFETEADACERHTAFYYHSLGQYVRYFPGRTARYVTADAGGSTAALRAALGLPGDARAGDTVRLTPAGLPPIDGEVDYLTGAFLGVRTADALYRFYGRDTWGWPVGVAHHHFGDEPGASAQDWAGWLETALGKEA